MKALGRYLVEEAQYCADLVLVVGDGDVEADHQRLGAFRAKAPGESGLLVMRVDRAGQGEHEIRKPALRRCDGRIYGVTSAGIGERVDV